MDRLYRKVLDGGLLKKEEILGLVSAPLDELTSYADSIRQAFMDRNFSVCGIINGKNGNCSEDCKFCAQSIHSDVSVESYGLRNGKSLLKEVRLNEEDGILRTSIVTSGRRLGKNELKDMALNYQMIRARSKVLLCGSHGLLDYEDLVLLKESGLTRYHCNLEASRGFFENICNSHSYDDRLNTILAAKKAGLEICSGGIIGMGETMEDRIDLALELRGLGVKSIAINIYSPLANMPKGSRLDYGEIRRVFAIFRFINPDAFIRFAAGRGNMSDMGEECFSSGANAIISGRLLNTRGVSLREDMKLLQKLGFKNSI